MNTSTLFDHYVLIRKFSDDYMRTPYSDVFVALHPDTVPTQGLHMTIMFKGIRR